MNIGVTGPKGMLGTEVCAAVERAGHRLAEIEYRIHEPINLREVEVCVDGHPIDALINCAGIVPQLRPKPGYKPGFETYWITNTIAPHRLALACSRVQARLIHVSTDCVFDGKDGPHSESAKPAITGNYYAASKLHGEISIKPHLTVRTSFVGAHGKHGLIKELQDLDREDGAYRASARLLWSGHTARFVAEALVLLAEKEGIYGILHIPGEFTDRLELVRKLKDALQLRKLNVYNNLKSEYENDRRLISIRWGKLGLPPMPSFDWQLSWLKRSV